MLCVGRGAAVAAAQHLAVLEQAARHRRRRGGDRGSQSNRRLLRGDAVFEMTAYSLFHSCRSLDARHSASNDRNLQPPTAKDGGSAEKAGALFGRPPRMAGVPKKQE